MKDPIEKLVIDMMDSVAQLRKLVVNQQELIAGIGALLQTHTTGLQMHQKAIEALAAQAGIAFDAPDEPSPSSPPN